MSRLETPLRLKNFDADDASGLGLYGELEILRKVEKRFPELMDNEVPANSDGSSIPWNFRWH